MSSSMNWAADKKLTWLSLLLGNNKTVITKTEIIVAKDGGEILLSDGSSLTILPNSVKVDTEITVTKATGDNGVLLILEPEGLLFTEKAVVKMKCPASMDNTALDVVIYSKEIPPVDIGSELAALEHLPFTKDGELLHTEIEHFSVIQAWGTPIIYPVFAIPHKYLQIGDLKYNLSTHLGVTNWVPGHVVMYTGTEDAYNIPDSDPLYLEQVESNAKFNGVVIRDRPDPNNPDPAYDVNSYTHLGTKRRKNISLSQLRDVANFALNTTGGYAILGADNGEYTDTYSCSGFVESAYESVGKGIVVDIPFFNAVVPRAQFASNNLETVKSITVEDGEVVTIKVYGVGYVAQSGLNTFIPVAGIPQYSISQTSYSTSTKDFTFDTNGMGRTAPYLFPFKFYHTYKGQEYSVTDTLTVYVDAVQGDFKVSIAKSAYGANHNNVCVSEFGAGWGEVDWTDLESYYSSGGNMSDLISNSGFDIRTNAWVTRNGDQSYSTTRDYFASYHNHSKPSGYLAHDNIDNYFLSLGSWDSSYYVLCKKN